MSIPMTYSREMLLELFQNIKDGKGSVSLSGTKISIVSDIKFESKKAKILFSPLAYEKQRALIQHNKLEVGWHGFIRRSDDDDNTFIVEDIVVYPQEVTGSTITPDQKEYELWRDELDDEHFNMCLYHGHSHVDMAVFPSGTDSQYQNDVLAGLAKDSFLVFMIWNKRGERWAKIYDKKNNCIFEKEDITIGIEGCEDMDDFLAESDKLVREHKTAPVSSFTVMSKSALHYDKDKAKMSENGKFDESGKWHDKKVSSYPYDGYYDGYYD